MISSGSPVAVAARMRTLEGSANPALIEQT
jgi:hypothetical protein